MKVDVLVYGIVSMNYLHESENSNHQHEEQRRPAMDVVANGLASQFHSV